MADIQSATAEIRRGKKKKERKKKETTGQKYNGLPYLHRAAINSLSSMSETSSSMHGKCGEQKPRRAPRRMKAAIRCRSEDDAYPHQALQAYSNLVMTTDLKTACRAVSHKQRARSMVSAYTVCEHLLTILLTWSLTDSWFEMVTPSILIVDTRRMSGSDDGWVSYGTSSSYHLSQFQLTCHD